MTPRPASIFTRLAAAFVIAGSASACGVTTDRMPVDPTATDATLAGPVIRQPVPTALCTAAGPVCVHSQHASRSEPVTAELETTPRLPSAPAVGRFAVGAAFIFF